MSDIASLTSAALETWPEPMLVWTPDGRVAVATGRFLEVFGLRREDVEGATERGLSEALMRRGALPLPAPAQRTAAGGRRYERRARPLDGGGRLDVFHDVTEQGGENERREQLLGVATHDLRSPLANVRSYAGLLLGGKMANLEPRARRSAEVIARNADRALRLIQTWFDSLRAENGRLEVERQPVPLLPLVADAVSSRRPIAAERGTEIAEKLPDSLPTVAGDHDRLLHSIGAFLDNALARTAPQGRVEVIAEERPDAIWIGFADEGAPIAPDEASLAFDRDEQILREKKLGVGFQLSVARAIIGAHGGSAGIESSPTRTMFWLTLPR